MLGGRPNTLGYQLASPSEVGGRPKEKKPNKCIFLASFDADAASVHHDAASDEMYGMLRIHLGCKPYLMKLHLCIAGVDISTLGGCISASLSHHEVGG